MSDKGEKDYLFLIWKSGESGKQFIVGRLTKNNRYEFEYCEEIKEAIEDGFVPLLCFPDLDKVYADEKLFPIFSSRLPDRKRKNIRNILEKYGMKEYDEYLLLKRSGAKLPIDSLEFIDPIWNVNENMTRIFFVAGVEHYLDCNGTDCSDAMEITRGDEVFLERTLNSMDDECTIQLVDSSGKAFGCIPRYYSKSVAELLEQKKKIVCHIYNVDKNKNCNECIKVIMRVERTLDDRN